MSFLKSRQLFLGPAIFGRGKKKRQEHVGFSFYSDAACQNAAYTHIPHGFAGRSGSLPVLGAESEDASDARMKGSCADGGYVP